MCHLILPRTLRGCHGNEIWDKIGYNLGCVRDICEIFAFIGEFSEWASECCQSNYTPTDTCCNGNGIWDKMSYNSTGDVCNISLFIYKRILFSIVSNAGLR